MAGPKEKKKLIENLPFPLAKVYQKLLGHIAIEKATGANSSDSCFWDLWTTWDLTIRMVGIWALCNYLDNEQDHLTPEQKYDLLQSWRQENWSRIVQILARSAQQNSLSIHKLASLPSLMEYRIDLKPSVPKDAMEIIKIQPRKMYNWVELVELLENLETAWRKQLLPSDILVEIGTNLLEQALLNCPMLSEYQIYVLVGRDEQKIRAFVCQGTRSRLVAIRGHAHNLWNSFKQRPFLSTPDLKQQLPLFPLLLPLLQKKLNDHNVFVDLMIPIYTLSDCMMMYGYRCEKLLINAECDPSSAEALQRQWNRMESHTYIHTTSSFWNFHENIAEFNRHFVERKDWLLQLKEHLSHNICGYLHLETPAGYGKTAWLSWLYQTLHRHDANELSRLALSNMHFLWHFTSHYDGQDDPVLILQSWYQQILDQLYGYDPREIHKRMQRLPISATGLRQSFQNLLEHCSTEILEASGRQLILVLDGLDQIRVQIPANRPLEGLLPLQLPPHIFVLLSFRSDYNTASDTGANPASDTGAYQTTNKNTGSYQLATLAQLVQSFQIPWLPLTNKETSLFSWEEFQTWVTKIAEIRGPSAQYSHRLLWEKSSCGNPFYLWLWSRNFIPEFSDSLYLWPTGYHSLLQWAWDHLPNQTEFFGYRILGILSILPHPATYALLYAVLEQPPSLIHQELAKISSWICEKKGKVTIVHPLLAEFIRTQFHFGDHIQFQKRLLEFYGYKKNTRNYLPELLLHLAHHYHQNSEADLLFELVMDDSYKDQKVAMTKSYYLMLCDISMAMEVEFLHKKYRELFLLGYRYQQVYNESLKELTRGLHAAQTRDYELALEKLGSAPKEILWFPGLLLTLWHLLEHHDQDQIPLFLDELQNVPDEWAIISPEIEPWLTYLLEQQIIQGLPVVPWLIKHHEHGGDAIEYLCRMYQRLQLTKKESSQLLSHLLDILDHFPSSSTRDTAIFRYLTQILPLWRKLEIEQSEPLLWQRLISQASSISNLSLQLQAFENLACMARDISKNIYLEQLQTAVVSRSAMVLQSIEINVLVTFARLISEHPMEPLATAALDRAFNLADPSSNTSTEELWRGLFPLLRDSSQSNFQEIWWLRCKDYCQRYPHLRNWELLALGHSYRLQWAAGWKILLEHPFASEIQSRIAIYQEMLNHPKLTELPFIASDWQILLDSIEPFAMKYQESEPLLWQIAKIWFTIKLPPETSIWDRYLSIVVRVQNPSVKDSLNTRLAIHFAQQGCLNRARFLIQGLPKQLQNQPLAEVALQLLQRGESEGGLEIAVGLSDIHEQVRVLCAVADTIPSGEAGALAWHDWSVMMARIMSSGKLTIALDYFIKIAVKFFRDSLTLEPSPIWHQFLQILDGLPGREIDKDGKVIFPQLIWLKQILQLLQETWAIRQHPEIWDIIHTAKERLPQDAGKAILLINMAKTARHLKIKEEAEIFAYLTEASAALEQENDKPTALSAFIGMMVLYRELGMENECDNALQKILDISGLGKDKMIPSWNPYQFLVELAKAGLHDMVAVIALRLLDLQNNDVHTTSSGPEILAKLTELCMEAQHDDWTRILFYRLLPHLSKVTSLEKTRRPLHRWVCAILESLAKHPDFHEFWERMQEMIPNFSDTTIQHDCMEGLAVALIHHGMGKEHHTLWQKWEQLARHVFHNANIATNPLISLLLTPVQEGNAPLWEEFSVTNELPSSLSSQLFFSSDVVIPEDRQGDARWEDWTTAYHWLCSFPDYDLVCHWSQYWGQKSDLAHLFELYILTADRYQGLCEVTIVILRVILATQGKETWMSWVSMIASHLGLNELSRHAHF